jgi:hypothetical protein
VLFFGPDENGTTWGWLAPPTVTNNRFGPEINLGQRLVVSGTCDLVAQVKYAVGGTTLAVDWDLKRTKSQYAQMSARAGTAINDLRAAYPGRQVFVAGFFWMQGESDAWNADMAAYATNLTTLIEHARADFHAPGMPVILGRIRGGYLPFASAVWQAEADVAANVADVRMVVVNTSPGSAAGSSRAVGYPR